MNDEERADFQRLAESLEVVDDWAERISVDGDRPAVAARSPLAGDDRRSAPYGVSWGVWHSLSHAVDHLHCLRDVLLDAQMLHIYAPYTLLRGAVENAAAAAWVLAPASRDARVTRRLRLAAVDMRNGTAAAQLIGATPPRALDDRLQDLRDLARRDGLEEKEVVRQVSYAEIVRTVGEELPGTANLPLLIWKACSAVAHGDLWATVNVTELERLDEVEGMVGNRVSASVRTLSFMAALTVRLTETAWSLYDRRGQPPY